LHIIVVQGKKQNVGFAGKIAVVLSMH
jgi:hypothetical protein